MKKKELQKHRFDSAYKALFSNPRIFYQLIHYFVDEDFVKEIQPENIKRLEKSSFVSEEFLQRESDLIYHVELNNKDLYFYILIEFQSTPDKRIPVRLYSYLFLFYEQIMKQSQRGKLPAVFPMVLYNGAKPWNIPTNIQDLIDPGTIPDRYIPHGHYMLLDEKKVPDAKLEEVKNLVSAVVYFEKHGSQDDLEQTMDKIKELLSDEVFEDIRQYIKWISHISGLNMSDSALIKLHSFAEGKEMVETLADDIREDGMQKGMQKGIQQGIQQGKQEGEKNTKLSIAASMKQEGFDTETIRRITGLDKKQIEAI